MGAFNFFAILGALISAVVGLLYLGKDGHFVRSTPLGNILHERHFEMDRIPDLDGKFALVTGANTGIGQVTARELARNGAHVIVGSRSIESGERAAREIREITGSNKVEFMQLDLSGVAKVQDFVQRFREKNIPLNILVLNAGVMSCPYTLSDDGVELQFAVNHIGHWVLTYGLLDIIEKSTPARIVSVSSSAHTRWHGAIDYDTLSNEANYDRNSAYSRSKIANIHFARDLARRVNDKQIWVNIVHPGAVATDLLRHLADVVETWVGQMGKNAILKVVNTALYGVEDGSLTHLYAATSPEIESENYRGEYFIPIGVKFETTDIAKNETEATRLYEWTKEFVSKVGKDL